MKSQLVLSFAVALSSALITGCNLSVNLPNVNLPSGSITVNPAGKPSPTSSPGSSQILPQSQSGPVVVSADPAIMGLYYFTLGRSPDADGAMAFTTQFKAGALTIPQIRQSMATGSEAAQTINSYYQTFLGRDADASGLNTWESALASGLLSMDEVLIFIANSPEATNGSGPHASFAFPAIPSSIEGLYYLVFGRAPDDQGGAAFGALLLQGQSTAMLRSAMASSPEAAQDISRIYQQYLNRAPSDSELSADEQLLGTTSSLTELFDVIVPVQNQPSPQINMGGPEGNGGQN